MNERCRYGVCDEEDDHDHLCSSWQTPENTDAGKCAAEIVRLSNDLGLAQGRAAQLEIENERLRQALNRAARWGMTGRDFDAHTACDLEDWVNSGMRGELPPLEPYLTLNTEVIGRHEGG